MAGTTPNFGFQYPQATDNLSAGASKIQELADNLDATFLDLRGGTTGQYLTKQTNTQMDFQWTTLPAIPPAFPIPGTGRYFGNWHQSPWLVRGTGTPVLNLVYYCPIYVSSSITIDRIAMEVATGTGGGGTARLGLYDSDGTSYAPLTRLADFGTVTLNPAGVKELTISQSITAGLKYLAINLGSTGWTYRSCGNATNAMNYGDYNFPNDTATAFGAAGNEMYTETVAAVGLNATASPALTAPANTPIIVVRVA